MPEPSRRELLVVGAGGLGREVAQWSSDAGWTVVGFVDDGLRPGATVGSTTVLGDTEWAIAQAPPTPTVIGVGAPAVRGRLHVRLRAAGVPSPVIVHPTAVVGGRSSLGDGTVVCPGAVVTVDVDIAEACVLHYNATVGHDTRIGPGSVLAPGVDIAGNVTIGGGVNIGIGAAVIQGITIGDGAVVGAGAVVIRDVDPGVTVVGVPARPLVPRS
jgi:sugar O-acyltransferase (sialic acid O-acetyltransferase NeuD family)